MGRSRASRHWHEWWNRNVEHAGGPRRPRQMGRILVIGSNSTFNWSDSDITITRGPLYASPDSSPAPVIWIYGNFWVQTDSNLNEGAGPVAMALYGKLGKTGGTATAFIAPQNTPYAGGEVLSTPIGKGKLDLGGHVVLRGGKVDAGAVAFGSGIDVESGTFQASSADLSDTGSVTMEGGTMELGTDLLNILGDFTQTGGTLSLEIAGTGTTPGTDFGQLRVSGTVSLAGNLAVTVPVGAYPAGHLYTIIKNTSGEPVSGMFVQGDRVVSSSQQATVWREVQRQSKRPECCLGDDTSTSTSSSTSSTSWMSSTSSSSTSASSSSSASSDAHRAMSVHRDSEPGQDFSAGLDREARGTLVLGVSDEIQRVIDGHPAWSRLSTNTLVSDIVPALESSLSGGIEEATEDLHQLHGQHSQLTTSTDSDIADDMTITVSAGYGGRCDGCNGARKHPANTARFRQR